MTEQLKAPYLTYTLPHTTLRYGGSSKPTGRDHYSSDKIAEDVFLLLGALGRQSCTLVAHGLGRPDRLPDAGAPPAGCGQTGHHQRAPSRM